MLMSTLFLYKSLYIFVTSSILNGSNVTEERRRDEKKKAYLG
ncbi:hypothetical protein ALT785_470038 [Alteromonas infernus]